MLTDREPAPTPQPHVPSRIDDNLTANVLFDAYSDSSEVGLSIIDSDFRYLALNQTLADMNGFSISDHMGRTVREVLGDFTDTVEPQLRHVLSTGEPVRFERSGMLPARSEPGDWIFHYLPIKNERGIVSRIGVVLIEVTAQKKLAQSFHRVSTKLRREVNRLHMLTEISNLFSSNWDVKELFPQISARMRRVFHHELASFALHDPTTGLLIRQSLDFPLGKGLRSSIPISAVDSPAGHSLKKGTAMIFSHEELQTFDVGITRELLAEGIQSLCSIPLLRPKGALGVVVLGSTRKDAFQTEDLTVLTQVGAQFAIALENHRAAAELEALKHRLSVEETYLEVGPRPEGLFTEIIGESPVLRQVLDQVATVAPSDASVLISGETGTGKELVARALHQMGHRKNGPFIKLNCAAIPTGLLESELFGHEKGAFTGAVTQKIGRMELANGGTLFLDEVGEISLDLQPKLLRVLQDQEFERLGGTRTIKVSVRLVAATNRDLAQEIADHNFRSDLFYRLNVFPIHMPALRDRREDIPLLVRHFVRKFSRRMNRHIETVPTETIAALRDWSWPGNVRELENLMERSIILSDGSALKVPLAELRATASSVLTPPNTTLENAEREHIIRVLRETRGVLSGPHGAAGRLGLKRTTLQSKMQRLNIRRSEYMGASRS